MVGFRQLIRKHEKIVKVIGLLAGNFLLSLLLILTVLQYQTRRIVKDSEKKILLAINEATRRLDDEINSSRAEIVATIVENGEISRRQVGAGFSRVNHGIGKIDVVYSDLLDEEKKKRVDVLLSDKSVANRIELARTYINDSKYAAAYDLLRSVVDEQPENLDARFLSVYSLFNKNKMKKENYSTILTELAFLEKSGYSSQEMESMHSYISTELDAISNKRAEE